MRWGVVAAATLAAGAGLARTAHGQATPPVAATAADGLPPGPGHDLVTRTCSGCHAVEVVTQQRLTPQGWHDIVETMAGNGAQATDAEFAQITDYLAKAFPAAAKP